VLSGYGCHVVTAADGAMAIDLLSRQKFDLVLSLRDTGILRVGHLVCASPI